MHRPIPVDLVIEAKWIIPVEPAGVVLENHAVAVHEGRIVAISQQSDLALRYAAKETKCLRDHVLIPGLINLHTHAAMTLFRGLADDCPLMDWLKNHIWPAEAKHLSPPFVYDGTLLACAEMLRSGITCFNDMYFFPASAAKAAMEMGMRASIGLVVMDFPTAYAADCEDYLAKGLAVRDELRANPLLRFCLAPHAPYTVSDRSFSRILTLAEQCDVPIHIHVHETRSEVEESLDRHGMRPLDRLFRLGIVGPGMIAVHAVHLSPAEVVLLAENGVSVAHCPVSNLKLASGICPLNELLESGVNVGLGTDGAASNNRLDILQEMRMASLLAKGKSGRAEAVGAHQSLRMATIGGAKALGLENEIGSIVVGKAADLVAIRIDDAALAPCYDPLSLLAYSAGREYVSDVWVGGNARICAGKLLSSGEIGLKNLASLWQNRIRP